MWILHHGDVGGGVVVRAFRTVGKPHVETLPAVDHAWAARQRDGVGEVIHAHTALSVGYGPSDGWHRCRVPEWA